MTFSWGDYAIVDLGPRGDWKDLSKDDAKLRFTILMDARTERGLNLVRLAQMNGYEVDTSNEGVQALNDMIYQNVFSDPERPEYASPEWLSVAIDAGLFLGDIAIGRCPSLRWGLNSKAKAVSRNQPVLVGFTRADNPAFDWGVVNGALTYTTAVSRRGVTYPVMIEGHLHHPQPPKLRLDAFVHTLSTIADYA